MLAADHISAVKRSFESRAMRETEKPPARLVDNGVNLRKLMVDIFFYFLLTTIIHVSMIKKCI